MSISSISSTSYFGLLLCTPWRRQWQATPVLLPGKSRGQRSLAGNIQKIYRIIQCTFPAKRYWIRNENICTKPWCFHMSADMKTNRGVEHATSPWSAVSPVAMEGPKAQILHKTFFIKENQGSLGRWLTSEPGQGGLKVKMKSLSPVRL